MRRIAKYIGVGGLCHEEIGAEHIWRMHHRETEKVRFTVWREAGRRHRHRNATELRREKRNS